MAATNRKRFTGLDSLIITQSGIAKRSSMITSELPFDEGGVLDLDSLIEVPDFDEEMLLAESLDREPGGQYRILEQLTEGGMGRIFDAFDTTLMRPVAMKVIQPRLRNRFSIFESFIREARITAQLEHPNIVPVHDLGYIDDHGSFFTMKLIDGEPLIDILHQIEFGDPVYLRRYDSYALLGIFRKVCDAVAFAHSKQIIHRDIKPHNIMVGDYGEVLLMDWGLARQTGKELSDELAEVIAHTHAGTRLDASTTTTGIVKGSPSYMSPEQALGDPSQIDEQSDIFLLGATLYHMFTFYPPYMGDDIYAIVDAARNADFVHPAQLSTSRTTISEDLVRIILRAMAPEKADRYLVVAEMAEDIDRLLRGELSNPPMRTFRAGERLMVEGQFGHEAYIIQTGQVRVEKSTGNGAEVREICRLGPGDIVGEMALISHEARSATVTADVATTAVVLDASRFERSVAQLPPWMNQTLTTLASRLRETTGNYA